MSRLPAQRGPTDGADHELARGGVGERGADELLPCRQATNVPDTATAVGGGRGDPAQPGDDHLAAGDPRLPAAADRGVGAG